MNNNRTYAEALTLLCALVYAVKTHAQSGSPGAGGTVRLWITATMKEHPVTDLKEEELQVRVGKRELQISALAFNPPEPLKVGLLIDTSGSRRPRWPAPEVTLAPAFLRRLIKSGDQVFIVDFNVTIYIDAEPTDNLNLLDRALERLATVRPYGGTALFDAIWTSCEQREATGTSHRALVVVSDGMDNASRYNADQAMSVVRKRGVQLYMIGVAVNPIHPELYQGGNARGARHRMYEMGRASGGESFQASNKGEIESAFNSIAEILHAQYALDFKPNGTASADSENRIKLKCLRRGVKILAPEAY